MYESVLQDALSLPLDQKRSLIESLKGAVLAQMSAGRYRRLVPDELDMLQTFPKGWTDTGMTDGRRAFCMGNALVVGIPHLIGRSLYKQN